MGLVVSEEGLIAHFEVLLDLGWRCSSAGKLSLGLVTKSRIISKIGAIGTVNILQQ